LPRATTASIQRKACYMSGDLVLSILLVIALYGLGVALLRLT
jgi:hypothetical protein